MAALLIFTHVSDLRVAVLPTIHIDLLTGTLLGPASM